ncbi:MAG: HAMP domain-containing sensor histidine kinase [Bacteroidota bacterium]|nr:HAMP domain-containing sensor histidine kinase [Bacteroidota bacterium]MDP3144464.1 HAMP domain-containing sensor histidine kinase [Bacteroidota bacterium]
MQKKKIHYILLVFSLVLMTGAILLDRHFTFSIHQISENASRKIEAKQLLAQNALNLLLSEKQNINKQQLVELFKEENIGIYKFKNDSLVYWNNAQIPLSYDRKLFDEDFGLAKLKQGYYLYIKKQIAADLGLTLCLLKPNYDLQNNYLQNGFSDWTKIPKEINIATTGLPENGIYLDKEPLFFLSGNDQFYHSSSISNVCFVIFLIGFIFSLVSILLLIKLSQSNYKTIILLVLIIFFRALMIWLKWPAFFYRSVLYDVQLFGNAFSSINSYLGDILINAIILLFLGTVFFLKIQITNKKTGNYLYVLFLSIVVGFVVVQFNNALISLVTDSTLSFDFLSIFSIKYPAYIALFALTCYCLAIFVLVQKLIGFFNGNFVKNSVAFVLLISCICFFIDIGFGYTKLFESYWLVVFALSLFILNKFNYSKNSLGLGLQILIMSIITASFFNFYINKNQKLDLNLLSYSLSERKDAILESEFANLPDKIANDEKLKILIEFLPSSQNEIGQLLKQNFFGGYFNRYNLEFSLFDKDCKPLLVPKDPILLNEGFFEDQIKYNETDSISQNLFFIARHKKNSRYIGKISLGSKNLYIRLEPKQFEELGSFPDLLVDESQKKPEKLIKFNHAVYRSGQISSRYGDFNYPYFISDSVALSKTNPDYVHYFFNPDEETQIIISQKTKSWNYYFTYNSYLFLFFSFVSYCSYLIYGALFTDRFKSSSFTRRIQAIIILLLLLAISAVGYTSAKLVTNQFEADNIKQLQEKTQTIINELATQFTPTEVFDVSQKELVNLKLKEYAHLFNTDISLFSKEGNLFNTSEPRLYDLGLAATIMNPQAYSDLKGNKTSATSVNEKAGELNYLSLYTPLFTNTKQLIGFVNLPYYAKQADLVNELSDIISAFINVYVILFVISILSGLILAGYITRPLQLIKQQIGNITFGKQNEKIKWKSNDEIGKLVSEYNQMLVKLEVSANLLAQSERESAWREMAKQVAHEIKNPLTPMKLNLQYLQHLMKNNPDDFKEKFEKASAGIIEQIDSLANIANEFSSFAKFPKTNLQSINLCEVINTAVLIFENHKNISITNNILSKELFVLGDKDQALRVFNNVLKNAVQALDETVNPKIEIDCQEKHEFIVISIKDNGCGIDIGMEEKLFTPNFTTKTTGSGIGLAMVKNIMQGFDGKVWFESELGIGTCFYLEFLKA